MLRRLRVGLTEQRGAQLRHHRLCDVVLHREDVLQRPVVGLRPEVVAVRDLDELHRDPHPAARFAHAAFEHRGYVKSFADFAEYPLITPALEGEG